MAIYAIGDIQGCYDDLLRLLEQIRFSPAADQLWFAGDLVNRGPKSLQTLRFVKSLGSAAVSVLGNHDLHLLATAAQPAKNRKKSSMDDVLGANDCDELLHWLRHRPLLHYNGEFCLVHAGFPPQWDLDTAKKMAEKVEKVLRGRNYIKCLKLMYGDKPDQWSEKLKGAERLRFIVNCLTRMRYCYADGRLDFEHSGPPGTQPPYLTPWFQMPARKSSGLKIVFGHWSALGYRNENNCYGIDTGCLWGGQLTALKLDQPAVRISIDCPGFKRPGKTKSEILFNV
ncbi:MAG: symmetrical bis(5'-nucleosyl)-tetraphosphatase [Gammaproteobacteria bacterium]